MVHGQGDPLHFGLAGTKAEDTDPMRPEDPGDNYNHGRNIVGRETKTPGNN